MRIMCHECDWHHGEMCKLFDKQLFDKQLFIYTSTTELLKALPVE